MDDIKDSVAPLNDFYRNSRMFLNKCDKPNTKEFMKIASATLVGFAIMGIIGYAVKLIHIPINNILVS
ncbi:uncharacterized protein MONBRDRAFT_19429 [Monosiga brevicollis MX1]|uniref:Uncharacterized protein n=1 Tax=Monosiga brevicollis TaxID=81824 RepID=A9UNJ1_MONBE|nr:uncharacterized protein MONBRDRAFT_19429 [Monosiga brevicollis MX1]EDQ93148.1 predicted protein [Monosiga brevicollis MX1]|eukprot:XP_001742910.1 hypothetical protein [Monosiga brevicollis MX1]